MLNVRNLSFSFQDKHLFTELSLTINAGSITCITGKSGIGKSTLLECIGQIRTNYDGMISFQDKNLKQLTQFQRASLLGFVFQQYNLFPHLTVLQNCIQPLMVVKKMDRKSAMDQATETLRLLGLQDYIETYPCKLSGGQQQRLAIARALVLQPRILCLDEPTSSLDKENTLLLVAKLKELSSQGITIICTSHDTFFIKTLECMVIAL